MSSSTLTIVQAAAFGFPTLQGSQVYVHGMSRALASRGHRVVVACYGHGEGEPDGGYEVARIPSVPGYRRVRSGPDPVKPLLDVALAGLLTRLSARADIVHAHNYEAPIAAYLARMLTGCPVVYNNHNTLSEELPQYFQGARARRLAKWTGGALDRAVPRRADAAIAISARAQPVLEELGCRDVTHVPPGVEPSDLVGAQGGEVRKSLALEGRPWVVYAGNPDAYQDLEILLEAMKHLEEPGLLMVSASPWGDWERRVECLPPHRRRLVTVQTWEETRNHIAAGDVAALPRTQCTGYPIKLLNTLGLGKPTVCSAGSWQPLPGAVQVRNGDIGAFADSLKRLCADDSMRQKLGQQAQEHVRENCTWEARAADLEAVYGWVIEAKKKLAKS
ncbi:MAG: glycosyltransferase family 4 protein [Myxococcota bacterium]|nr:glycosyltransferase family 4 protein [Myxococcota bacterium]